jgi:hypothetical protein
VKNSMSTVRFVGAGNSGASEQCIDIIANIGKKIMDFFMNVLYGEIVVCQ